MVTLIRKAILLLVLAAISPKLLFAFQDDWRKAKEKNGVSVWTRSVEATNIKEFKATAEFETSLAKIVTFFFDLDGYYNWVEECKSVDLLEQEARKLKYHMVLKVPFPFDNRDIIQELHFRQDPLSKILTINIENDADHMAEIDGLVRMPIAEGTWIFTPGADGKVQVIFQYLSDPGGKMPAWLVNSFIVQSPYNSMITMRELLKKPHYNADYDWLIEPSNP